MANSFMNTEQQIAATLHLPQYQYYVKGTGEVNKKEPGSEATKKCDE